MKMTKKKVLVIALAVSLVAIISMGTLAWFTAEDSIENQFHFTDSDSDGDTDFSVDVIETGDDEDDGLVFENVLPGDVWDKDPTIVNTSGSDRYSQYIRATLTLKDPTGAWKKALDEKRIGGGTLVKTSRTVGLLGEMFQTVDLADDPDWEIAYDVNGGYGYNEETKEIYWVFYYTDILKQGDSVKLFEKVTIPTGLTVEDASAMLSTFDITVKAEAVQAENLGLKSWQGAKDAFAVVEGN